jgi:hypothetical protein
MSAAGKIAGQNSARRLPCFFASMEGGPGKFAGRAEKFSASRCIGWGARATAGQRAKRWTVSASLARQQLDQATGKRDHFALSGGRLGFGAALRAASIYAGFAGETGDVFDADRWISVVHSRHHVELNVVVVIYELCDGSSSARSVPLNETVHQSTS